MRGGERISVYGRLFLNGEDVTNLKPHLRAKKGIILCPERRRIFPESSVMENLKIGAYLSNRQDAKNNLDYVLNLFPRLKDHLNRQCEYPQSSE